ncbi:MAP/microtubule affinity-regulating kinase 3 [Boothiomyces macroporosus]|uniref:MAP/microtubule affinity-regulating kinase 3 n=1 Tax=Boothiomyces macroporosus TaxID=261099 RepID=A0AAD5UQZ1_9FUNG|nr:MAP/microtubule affinity-regulating kinase 3 [Boothiomyces macroporosus]
MAKYFAMKLSNYEIGKTIGEGAFSKVKVGRHIPTGVKVAIKIMNIEKQKVALEEKKKIQTLVDHSLARRARKKIYADAIEQIKHNPDLNGEDNQVNLEEFMKKVKLQANQTLQFESEPSFSESMVNIQHEVLLLMKLSHPNIIKIFKVVESMEDIYIIMDYASGGDLSGYVARYGKLTELESRRIFRQIVSAMDFIHLSHVVHRDLKLENILLDNHSNTFCGTPFYCAPEVIGGKPYSGTKVDIWAMGVILYAMVTGFLPFVADSDQKLLQKLIRAEFEVPRDFSWELTDLLRNIFIEAPESRLDMKGIRHSRWVNIGEESKPLQIIPPPLNKEELAKLITSIMRDNNTTVYNIHPHEQVEDGASQLDKYRHKSANQSISDLKRKKHISVKQNPEISITASDLPSLNHQEAVENSHSGTLALNLSNTNTLPRVSSAGPGILLLTVNHEGATDLKRSRTTSAYERHSHKVLPTPTRKSAEINHEASKLSREASIVSRMSKVSLSSIANDFTAQEISDWHLIHKPPPKIRTMKFQFRKGLISSSDPPTMFQDLHRVLVEIKNQMNIKIAKPNDYYIFHVSGSNFNVEIELCKLWLLKMHGLKMKKTGNAEEFIKILVTKLDW